MATIVVERFSIHKTIEDTKNLRAIKQLDLAEDQCDDVDDGYDRNHPELVWCLEKIIHTNIFDRIRNKMVREGREREQKYGSKSYYHHIGHLSFSRFHQRFFFLSLHISSSNRS